MSLNYTGRSRLFQCQKNTSSGEKLANLIGFTITMKYTVSGEELSAAASTVEY
jgi:hypothetical protein